MSPVITLVNNFYLKKLLVIYFELTHKIKSLNEFNF